MYCRDTPLRIGVRLIKAGGVIDFAFRGPPGGKTSEWARNNCNRFRCYRFRTRAKNCAPARVDVMTAVNVAVSCPSIEPRAKGQSLIRARVLHQRSDVSKTAEDGANLGQICLV